MAAKKPISTNNLMLIIGLIGLVVLIMGFVAGRSLVNIVIRNQKVISAKIRANNQLDANITAAGQLKSSYQALGSAQQQVINNSLPTKDDLSGLASMLGFVSSTSGVKFKSINSGTAVTSTNSSTTTLTQPTSSSSGAMVSPFTLDVEGSYPALVTFMQNLELSARPVTVSAVTYTGNGSTVEAVINGLTYTTTPATITTKTEVIK